MRGRFAPSPTGAMHLGNARTALLAWLAARRANGTVVLRMEDLDRARVVAGAEARLLDELRWLGLEWDEGPDVGGPHLPYRQSERTSLYDAAIDRLLESGAAFPCACSRADVARAASAPHESGNGGAEDGRGENGDEGPRYPGTCLELDRDEVAARARSLGRSPVVRFRAGHVRLPFTDAVHGPVDPFGAAGIDDFVLRRADGTAAYQLAVVVDDAAMRITEVVRGDDLLRSTPRQLALYQALALTPPRFAHVPLVLAPGGERLAKRSRPRGVGDLRAAGVEPEVVIGALAASAGLVPPGTRARPADLIAGFDLGKIARLPVEVDGLAGGATSPR
jgi:glutamyl-tRNA synthetase